MSTTRLVQLSLAAIATLIAMVGITLATGVSQETFEIVLPPAVYTAALRDHARWVRLLFAIDTAFLVLYTALLVGFAQRVLAPRNRALVAVAIGAIVATAVLDMIEDHHILALLRAAERGIATSASDIVAQHTLSQVKFNVSYLALFLLGLFVPTHTRAGRALALLLTIGTVVQGAWLYAAPDALVPVGNALRWAGFVAGFALLIPLVRSLDDEGATGAPA